MCRQGRNIHNGPASLFHHLRNDHLTAEKGTLEVHVDYQIPVGLPYLLQLPGSVQRSTRIIHQDVNSAEMLDNFVFHRNDFFTLGDIGIDGMDRKSLAL